MEPKWGAILWKKWEIRNNKIIGFWAEDGNSYVIDIPSQLNIPLVEMQNWLSDVYQHIENLKDEVKRLERIFLYKS